MINESGGCFTSSSSCVVKLLFSSQLPAETTMQCNVRMTADTKFKLRVLHFFLFLLLEGTS